MPDSTLFRIRSKSITHCRTKQRLGLESAPDGFLDAGKLRACSSNLAVSRLPPLTEAPDSVAESAENGNTFTIDKVGAQAMLARRNRRKLTCTSRFKF